MPDETPSASINRELAAKITAAYVRRNQIGSDQLGTLISTVHQALASLGKPPPETSGEPFSTTCAAGRAKRDPLAYLPFSLDGRSARPIPIPTPLNPARTSTARTIRHFFQNMF